MMRCEFYINEYFDLTFKAYSEDKKKTDECYEKKAIKYFEKIVKWDNDDEFVVTKKDNDMIFTSDKFYIVFKDYEKTTKRIYELQEENKKIEKKNKIVIGAAAVATIGILGIGALAFFSHKKEDPKILVGVPISEDTNKIVEDNDIDVEEVLEEYDISEDEELEINESNLVLCNFLPVYDEYLDQNVEEYRDMVNKIGPKWGLDPEIIIDIMKQESHGGKVENKMQVTYSAWEDQVLTVYNFYDDKYEKVVLTDKPENYPSEYITITREEFKNPYTSISAGAIIFAYEYNQICGKNLPYTFVTYNYGPTAAAEVIAKASQELGLTEKEIIENDTDIRFIEYTNVRKNYGDPDYFRHIAEKSSKKRSLNTYKSYTVLSINEYNEKEARTLYFSNHKRIIKQL